MPTGPVEYIIVGFPENKFTGEIVPALQQLVESGTIRILDLVFIAKDANGDVLAVEVDEQADLSPFLALEGEVGGLINQEDIAYVAQGLEPNSSVGLLVWEDMWANPLVDALRAAGGVLIEGARVPSDLVETVFAELPSVD